MLPHRPRDHEAKLITWSVWLKLKGYGTLTPKRISGLKGLLKKSLVRQLLGGKVKMYINTSS